MIALKISKIDFFFLHIKLLWIESKLMYKNFSYILKRIMKKMYIMRTIQTKFVAYIFFTYELLLIKIIIIKGIKNLSITLNVQKVLFCWEIDIWSAKSSLCFTMRCTTSLKITIEKTITKSSPHITYDWVIVYIHSLDVLLQVPFYLLSL